MPDAAPKIDAVMVPQNYPPGRVKKERALAIKDEFGPILGSAIVHGRNLPGNQTLVTASPEVSVNHYGDHPLSGQPRYEWMDRGDGIQYGLLIPEPEVETYDPKVAAQEAMAKKVARRSELLADAHRTPAQDAELKQLERWVSVMGGERAEA